MRWAVVSPGGPDPARVASLFLPGAQRWQADAGPGRDGARRLRSTRPPVPSAQAAAPRRAAAGPWPGGPARVETPRDRREARRPVWIFDLDDTLHHASKHTFPVIDAAMTRVHGPRAGAGRAPGGRAAAGVLAALRRHAAGADAPPPCRARAFPPSHPRDVVGCEGRVQGAS